MNNKFSPPWTAAEDSLLRNEHARRLLPRRTNDAIETRRKALGIKMGSPPKWTLEEDCIVKDFSVSEATSLLRNRTHRAVRTRKTKLGAGRGAKAPNKTWTKREDKILINHRGKSLAKLAKLIRLRTLAAIKKRRCFLGLSTKYPPHQPWKITQNAELRTMWPTATKIEIIERFRPHS